MGAKRTSAVLSQAKAATLFQLGFVMAGMGGVLAEPIAAFVAAGNRQSQDKQDQNGRDCAHEALRGSSRFGERPSLQPKGGLDYACRH
jgi:hypothetical protein